MPPGRTPDPFPAFAAALAPGAVVTAHTPFGLEGPWADRPATEFTLQAWAGGILVARRVDGRRPGARRRPSRGMARRALRGRGRAHLVARSRETGVGELLDVSVLEVLALTMNMYPVTGQTMAEVAGTVFRPRGRRDVNIPAIERTADGWVGFMVATAVMWEAFCTMVGHREWLDDDSLYSYTGHASRREELEAEIRAWCALRTTDEIAGPASLLRVPVAPVGNGKTIPTFDHFVERKFYVTNPSGGFLQPDVTYTLGDTASRRPAELPAPRRAHRRRAGARAVPRAWPAVPADRMPFGGPVAISPRSGPVPSSVTTSPCSVPMSCTSSRSSVLTESAATVCSPRTTRRGGNGPRCSTARTRNAR